jgi:hypothetical protein
MRLYYLDKLGWPVERIKGRWFLNFLRILIHTRKYTFKKPYCLMTPQEKLIENLQVAAATLMDHPVEDHTPNSVTLAKVLPLDKPVEDGTFRLVVPNEITREALEKSERGEDVKSFDTVEELFEDLDS